MAFSRSVQNLQYCRLYTVLYYKPLSCSSKPAVLQDCSSPHTPSNTGCAEFHRKLDIADWYWILLTGHWTLDSGHWTLDTGHWTLDTGHWTLDTGHWTPVYRISFICTTTNTFVIEGLHCLLFSALLSAVKLLHMQISLISIYQYPSVTLFRHTLLICI